MVIYFSHFIAPLVRRGLKKPCMFKNEKKKEHKAIYKSIQMYMETLKSTPGLMWVYSLKVEGEED